jgi:hypothetical protein
VSGIPAARRPNLAGTVVLAVVITDIIVDRFPDCPAQAQPLPERVDADRRRRSDPVVGQ